VKDLGAPTSYMVLTKGADVYDANGEKVGRVTEIRADRERDIFDGIVVDESPLLPGGRREIPADQVDEIYERGVVLRAGA